MTLSSADRSIPPVCLPAERASRARERDDLQPRLRRCLGGGARLRALLTRKFVEISVTQPTGLGDGVPFNRRDRVGCHPATGGKDAGETILRNRTALKRGAPENARSRGL